MDAYVTDYTLLLNAIVKNPSVYEIAGDVFGPEDNYGIGLPLNSDGVAFVNAFLTRVVKDGTWARLWQISLGDRTGIDTAPQAPRDRRVTFDIALLSRGSRGVSP